MNDKLTRRLAYYYAALFAKPVLARFHYALLRLALRGLGVMNYYDRSISGEDYFITKCLPQLVRTRPPVFFDIGANRGEYAVLLARQFPDAKIFAFEPHPRNFEVLAKSKISNLSLYPIALGSESGQTVLYDRSDEDGSTNASLHPEVITELHGQSTISHTVDLETLDRFAASILVDFIDFLKIDVEGGELAILQGASNLIRQERIGVIQFEFNEMNIISHSFLHDFRKLLPNYRIFRLLPRGVLPVPDSPLLSEWFGFQNIVAVLQTTNGKSLADR
jgi:FkbM family methyltransferase